MKEPNWLLKQAVVAVHNQLISEFGGAAGIRDEGLLDSALDRPINVFNCDETDDLHRLAATYASGIVQDHPFVDGNKRTGFMSAYMFLGRNGHRVIADQVMATAMTLALAASEIGETENATWLGQSTEAWDRDA